MTYYIHGVAWLHPIPEESEISFMGESIDYEMMLQQHMLATPVSPSPESMEDEGDCRHAVSMDKPKVLVSRESLGCS
jgi:hypothetical protein